MQDPTNADRKYVHQVLKHTWGGGGGGGSTHNIRDTHDKLTLLIISQRSMVAAFCGISSAVGRSSGGKEPRDMLSDTII